MTKTFGAHIYCATCKAQPYPDDASIRESFDLTRTAEGWACELHRPPKQKRASRIAAATPAEALTEFERILAAENSRLEEAVAGWDDDNVATALNEHNEELGRALNELKKAFTAQTPARAETVSTKRPRLKPLTRAERDHEGQGDLIADQKTVGA